MIATDSVTEWLQQMLLPDRGITWLAEELLRHAAEGETVEWKEIDRSKKGIVRSLFVRLISIGRRETGLDLNLYGDRFQLTRITENGPAILDIDVRNSPSDWSLRIVKIPSRLANGTSYR